MARSKRKCRTCNRSKHRGLYLAREWNKKGEPQCKFCYKTSSAYKKELNTRYQRDFGITLDEYNLMLDEQDYRCAICNKQAGKRRLAVDHDHALERALGRRRSVRGLLCRACNEYLGHIGDTPAAGLALQNYLGRPTFVERNEV
jgi:hypothetical protein